MLELDLIVGELMQDMLHSFLLFVCVMMRIQSYLLQKQNSIQNYPSNDNYCFLEILECTFMNLSD